MRTRSLIIAGGSMLILVAWLFLFHKDPPLRDVDFTIRYNGTSETHHRAQENITIQEAVQQAGYPVSDKTFLFPAGDSLLTAGTLITLHSAKELTIEDQHETKTATVSALTVREALEQKHITLDGADFVNPGLETALAPAMTLRITRVTVTEETEKVGIPFEKKEQEDDTVSFLVKKVTQKGEVGTKEIRYRVSRHNGEVVAKEKLSESVTKEPTTEITTVGTKVTVVKKHTGGASWYAHTGTLAAANPWLPFGSYVRVTNTANGKSVIVKINDRGPFGAGRIIDLDKQAFAKIADLGTGVIQVVMEEIK